MCQYLYASFALKRNTSEGVTQEQLDKVMSWDRTIIGVAEQEMLHLSLANNLLSSLGAAPYFARPNFPVRSRYFPSSVRLGLMPLDELSLSYFLYLERPESMSVQDVPGFSSEKITVDEDAVVPVGQEFATVGQLYRGIETGIEYLAEKNGESKVFIGGSAGQATPEYFGWPELVGVTDLETAKKAVETIVTEGEGARGDWKNSHFGRFLGILNEFRDLRASDPKFEPSRPVVAAYAHPPADMNDIVQIIDDPFTASISDLFNGSYDVLLQILIRFFTQSGTTPEELKILSNTAIRMMLTVIKPLGHYLTTLPVGPHLPGITAGPVFEMFSTSNMLPNTRAATRILNERLTELQALCLRVASGSNSSKTLSGVASAIGNMAKQYSGI